jgi:predicted transcriptional regulator
MVPFAEQLPQAQTIESMSELKEVLDAIAQEFEASVVFNLKSPEQAVRDSAKRSQEILDAQ